jgi:CRP/FNR family transcriptional regulator, cyclic AMP receptor protein
MQEARIELLQRMPVFGGIRADILQFLLGLCPVVSVSSDEFFFREHDEGDSMFVLEAGKAAVLKSWRGQEYFLRTLKEGDCFGEMAVIDLLPRSASIRAVEDCTAIRLSAASLYQVYEHDLKQFALIQMNMGREVSRRLRESTVPRQDGDAGRGHRACFPSRLKMRRTVLRHAAYRCRISAIPHLASLPVTISLLCLWDVC